MLGTQPDNKHTNRCTVLLPSQIQRYLPWPQTAIARKILCKPTQCRPAALGTITSANKFILLYNETIDSFALVSDYLEHRLFPKPDFFFCQSRSRPFPAHESCRALESTQAPMAENDGDLPHCSHQIFAGGHLKFNGIRFVHTKR